MKIEVEVKELISALRCAGKAMDKKPAIMAQAYYLFERNGSSVTITAGGSMFSIKVMLPCEVGGDDTPFLLPVESIKYLSKVADETVTIDWDGATIKIISTGSEIEYPAIKEQYPKMEEFSDEQRDNAIVLPILSNAMRKAINFCDENVMSTQMQCVYVKKEGINVDVVATTGTYMALIQETSTGAEDYELLFHKKVASIMSEYDYSPRLCESERSYLIRYPHMEIVTRKFQCKYFAYRNALVTSKVDVVLYTESLKSALDRMQTLNSTISTIQVEPGNIILSSVDGLGIKGKEFITHMSNIEEIKGMKISATTKMLAMTLTEMESEKVKVRLTSPDRAILIEPADCDKEIYLVMPMLV